MNSYANLLVRVTTVLSLVATIACANPEKSKQKYMARADANMAAGEYAEAILQYRNALKVDRRFGEARYKLAQAYEKTGNARNAAEEYVRAADLLPARADVQITAAGLMLSARDFEAARKYAQRALTAEPGNVTAQIVLAYTMAGLKDPEGAVRELEEAAKNAPEDARPYTSLGALRASAGDKKDAEAAFKKAVAIDGKSAAAHLALAYFYWSVDRTAEAEAGFKQALELDQKHKLGNRMLAAFYLAHGRAADAETPLLRLVNAKDPQATLTLAELYVRTGRPADARKIYEQLARDKGTDAVAVARMAALDYAANKREEAHRAVADALKANPSSADLLTIQAQFFVAERKLTEANDAARKALAAAPQFAPAHNALGLSEAGRGNVEEAIQAFRETLRLNPGIVGPDLHLSRLFLARGEVQESLKHAEAARRLQPKNPEVRLQLASAMLANKDAVRAETELKSLLTEYPKAAPAHGLYGQVLLARGDRAGAAREYDTALQLNPTEARALTGRLMLDLNSKRPEDGRARLSHALDKNPDSADLRVLAARFEQTVGDSAAAEKHLRIAVEKDPGNLSAYSTLGGIYIRQRRLDEARKEFEEVVKRDPESIGARTMIGVILEAQNKQSESTKIYEDIISRGKRAPVAANNLAWIYASRGEKLDIALQLAQNAKQHLPDSPEVNDTLGWVYYKKDMPELAVRPLETSVAKDPRNVLYRYHLGLAYAKAGQPAKARAALEEALRLKPDFDGADEARRTLGSLKG